MCLVVSSHYARSTHRPDVLCKRGPRLLGHLDIVEHTLQLLHILMPALDLELGHHTTLCVVGDGAVLKQTL